MSNAGQGPLHSERAVVRQSGLTGVAAGISVALGLLLDITIAARFGAGSATDSFFVAARIPLALAAVVTVAANQALVPAFRTSLTKRGEQATHRLISMIVSAVLIAGAALLLLVWLVARPLMRITAPGITDGEVTAAAAMVPALFAMVPLLAVFEVMRAYLNSRYRFIVPALVYGVNTGVAACIVLLGPVVGWRHDIHLVAWAYLLGAGIQAAIITVLAVHRGLRLRPALDPRDPQLRSTGRLVIRPLTGAGLNPVCRLGEQVLVSFLPPGSITILNYGYRLISAIGGTVFFRSVIVALVPRLTEAHAQGDLVTVRRTTGIGLRIMLAISLPLTAFVAALSHPGAVAIFHRGSLTLASASLIGAVLAVYSISLVGQAVQRALLAPFFARLDTRTVLRNTVYGVAANLVLLPVLTLPFGRTNSNAVLGVALAYSLAQYVNVGHAWYRLRSVVPRPAENLAGWAVRLTAASLLSGGAMIGAVLLFGLDKAAGRFTLLLLTALVGIGGAAILGAAMFVLTGNSLATMWRALRSGRPAPQALVVPRSPTPSPSAGSARPERPPAEPVTAAVTGGAPVGGVGSIGPELP